jgi:hypothetical protein
MSKDTTGKNAYEIRLEVLQMALGLAQDRYHATLEQNRMHAEFEAVKTGSKYTYELPPDNRQEEALVLADSFYSFIENKQ